MPGLGGLIGGALGGVGGFLLGGPAGALAGGSIGAGLLGGLTSPSGAFDAASVTPDTTRIEELTELLSNPQFGLDELLRIATQAAGNPADYLQRVNALGGSALQANVQATQARREATQGAFDAQRQLRLGAIQTALQGNLGLAGIQQQGQMAAAQSGQQAANQQGQFFGQLLGGGLGFAGYGFGNDLFGRTTSQPTTFQPTTPAEITGGIHGGSQTLGPQSYTNPPNDLIGQFNRNTLQNLI